MLPATSPPATQARGRDDIPSARGRGRVVFGRPSRTVTACTLVAFIFSQLIAPVLAATDPVGEARQLGGETSGEMRQDFEGNSVGYDEATGVLRLPGPGIGGKEVEVNVKELFPGLGADGKTRGDYEKLYGDQDALVSEMANTQTQMMGGSSPRDSAFQATYGGILSNPRPDLTYDPIFRNTDLMRQFVDTGQIQCDPGQGGETLVHCRKPTDKPVRCIGNRVFKTINNELHGRVAAVIGSHGTIHAKLDFANGTYEILNGLSTHAGQIDRINYDEVCASGNPRMKLAASHPQPWYDSLSGEHDPTFDFTVEQQPTCANGMVAIVRSKDTKGGSDTIVQGFDVFWIIHDITEDYWVWTTDEGIQYSSCPAEIEAVQNGTCQGSVRCTDNPQDCVTLDDGETYCGQELKPPPGGMPAGCRKIEVEKLCGGAVQQPTDECRSLERQGCAFVSGGRCLLRDSSGRCLIVENTYNCSPNLNTQAACQAAQHIRETKLAEDCEKTVTPVETQKTVREPRYVTCEILRRLTRCSVARDLAVDRTSESHHFHRDCFDSDTISFKAGWTYPTRLDGSTYGWTEPGLSWTRDFVLSAGASLSYSGSHTSASITQYPSASNDWTAVVQLTGPGQWVDVPNPTYQSCMASHQNDPNACAGIPQTIQELQCPAGTYIDGTIAVSGDKLRYGEKHSPAEPDNNPCVKDQTDWTNVNWTCTASGVSSVGGYTITPDRLIPLIPGDDGSCQAAEAVYDPKDYNVGIGECWVNPQGENVCLDNTNPIVYPPHPPETETTNCTALENDPNCRLVDTRRVVRYSNDNVVNSFDYVLEKRFDCGTDQGVTYQAGTRTAYQCPTDFQCMGGQCFDYQEEPATTEEFARAAAYLQAAQQAQMDMNCGTQSDPSQCRVFSGHHMECKKAVGGWQDCCSGQEVNVRLADYIELIRAINHLDSAILKLKDIQMLKGVEFVQSVVSGWERMRDVTFISDVEQGFNNFWTSAYNNTVGKVIPEAALSGPNEEIAAKTGPIDALIDSAKDWLIQRTREWLTETFADAGVDMGNFLFGPSGEIANEGVQATANSASSGAGSQAASQATSKAGAGSATGASSGGLVGMIGTILNVVAILYAIYAILDILVNIIWACDMEEFQLAVQKELRNCHYVGSYCKGFLCVEKRESYCCFNSPLARIINVQARQQLGVGDGSPDDPNCDGLTLEQLGRVDFERIDLSEWIDILMITGHFPTRNAGQIDSDLLTGSGSPLSPGMEGQPRLPVETRTVERANGIDANEIRSQTSHGMYP